MNPIDYFLLIIIAFVLVGAFMLSRSRKKKGNSCCSQGGCNGDCSCCKK